MAKSKRKRVPKTVLKLPDLEQSKSAVFNEQCPGGLPTALLDLSSKESSNFLLLSKRSRAIIPVGNLKVDSQ